MAYDDANQLLTHSGAPPFKFVDAGDTVTGKVTGAEKRASVDFATGVPKTWDNGDPMYEVVITLDTGQPDQNDETERRIFARGNMLKAIREALKAAGAQLEQDGTLTVRYVGDGESTKRGFSPPKLFKAKYVPPTAAALDLDEL